MRFIAKKQKEGNKQFIDAFPMRKVGEGNIATYTIEDSKYTFYKYEFDPEFGIKKDTFIDLEIHVNGLITAEDGIRLHQTPSPQDELYISGTGKAQFIYGNEQPITIIAKGNSENIGWVLIETSDGEQGWIENTFVREKTANELNNFIKQRYTVKAGQGLEDIIEEVYYNSYDITIGNDFQDIALAIQLLNVDNTGVYFTNDDDPLAFIKNDLDPGRANVRKNYQSIRLKEGAIIELPSKEYIDLLRDSGSIGTRSEEVNMLIEFGRGSIGLIEGLHIGFLKQGVEIFTEAWDMIKGIFTGELWGQFKELYTFFTELTWEKAKELFSAFATDFENKWNQKNVEEKWKFRGEIIGRILFEIVLAIFTGGAGLLKNVTKLKSVQKLLSKAKKLADKLKKGVSNPLKKSVPDKDITKKIFDEPPELDKIPDDISDNVKMEKVDDAIKNDKLDNEKSALALVLRMKRIVSKPFKKNSKHNYDEFVRQLKGQEDGLNKLTVDDFIKNRDKYLNEGRSKGASAAQKRFNEQVRADKIVEYRKAGLSRSEAKIETDKYMSNKAALHDPDQIAGGFGENVTGLGDRGVNSSLGVQWKNKIGDIDTQIREIAKSMSKKERETTYLNIILDFE